MSIETRKIVTDREKANEFIEGGYVVSTSNHNRNNRDVRYHTDPNCSLLDRIQADYRVMEEEYAKERNMCECKQCSGEYERQGGWNGKDAHYWKDKDPEDVLGD